MQSLADGCNRFGGLRYYNDVPMWIGSPLLVHGRCQKNIFDIANIIAYNKKMIYDIYDYYIDSHNLPDIMKKFVEKQEIKTINYADTTIICSEQRKEQIKNSKPKNLIVIHNSPNIPKELNTIPSVIKSKTKNTKIVYIGILQDDRLLLEISEDIKRYPQYELHIGGFGKYKNYFEEQARINENIFFYGNMEYNNVLKLESECDFLFATYNPIIANHSYSAPNKFYEAIALR